MKNDIELFPYMKYNNEKMLFHYSEKMKNIKYNNQLDLSHYYSIYNNYNQIEEINNKIRENKNIFYSLQNNDKKNKNNNHNNKFEQKRRKILSNNLSENISIKNSINKRKYIKNMKYNFLGNNIFNSSNNRFKKIIKHNSIPKLDFNLKSLIDNKDNSDISYKQNRSNYSYDTKNEKRNKIIKRNKQNNLNSSKSYSLFEKRIPSLDRPKSNEYKIGINNKIIYNYLNKKNNLYNNKMARIDKYLITHFSDKNKKHKKSWNNRNINNIITNTAKNYFTGNEIQIKKSNKNKISPNNILNKKYNSSRIKEPDKEIKIEKLYKTKNKGWKIKLNNNIAIDNNIEISYSSKVNKKNYKNIYTITPYVNENINDITKHNLRLLNSKIPNNYILKKNKLEENNKNKEQLFINNINEQKIRKNKSEKEYIINYNYYKTRNKNNKSKNIYLNKTESNTISSHKTINQNKNEKNFIDIQTYKDVYKNNFNYERTIQNNQLYDSLNNKENIHINNNQIISNDYINEKNYNKNKTNSKPEITGKKYFQNNFQKRYNSSYFIFNKQKINKEQNTNSLIRRYLHYYYEIKSIKNMKKNNSFKNRNHYINKDFIVDNTLRNNLLNNLIKKDENNNNNIFYNNLSSNVNININITPHQLSRENINIKLKDNINNNKNLEKNEYNSKNILTPSFLKTKKELNKEDKEFIKNNILNNFPNYNKDQENKNIDINNLGYDYTFKNINFIKKDYNDLNKENKNNNNKINYGKRKEDLIHLLHFSENLGLNLINNDILNKNK